MTVASNESAIGTGLHNQQSDGLTAYYFPRRLRIIDAQGEMRQVNEAAILSMPWPRIVLGEPGMGKSRLIAELGQRLGVQPITAVRFLHHKNPGRLVIAGKPLLIDGLDEAMARRDGDAVDMILAQLEEAGSPDFILSCRAREWQARTVTNLCQIYSVEPTILTLEALNREEASIFLAQRYPTVDSEHVLIHLDEHGIAELYSNPLTLGLMGQVAERDTQLPATRAALFERVSILLWPEHDPNRQDIGLGKITQDQALSAAGAIMAGLLLAGGDAVSLAGSGQLQDGDVSLAELEALPEATAAREIFSSKLFYSVGANRAKPIHRVIAEFLGARWLAQQATVARSQRRLLRQLQGSGAVPASLRGLHAWLAFHSLPMAIPVIAADPFGVLRHGETTSLTAEQADCMFDAFQSLAELDPYFRAQDWDSHPATGLMRPSLRAKVESTIASAQSNTHFRFLLIEGLKNTPLAGDLANTLEAIMFSTERFYHERADAAEALVPYRNRAWWQQAVSILRDQGTEDSTRLARNMIEEIVCDVTDDLLVATLLAELGVTICPLPKVNTQRALTLRHYGHIVDMLPTGRLMNVLNLLVEHAPLLEDADWQSNNDLAELATLLFIRAIDEKVVLPENAAQAWNWLGILQRAENFHRDTKNLLQVRLDADENLRRAIQYHALYGARPRSTIWVSEFDLSRRMVGLAAHPQDVTWFLDQLAESDNKDPVLREDWCDLIRLGIGPAGFPPNLRLSSDKFQAGDQQLDAFVRRLENPKKTAWMRKEERNNAKREKRGRIDNEIIRRFYSKNRAKLRAGELGVIVDPGKAYLGLFRNLSQEKPPTARIADWLGAELADDVMAGLEAVLHRSDIPSPEQVAKGFVENKIWNYCYAILAGLLARQHAGLDFENLSTDVRTTGLLLLYENPIGLRVDDDLSSLRDALEESVISTTVQREDFARNWIEPSLVARKSNASGLYVLAHNQRWKATATALVPGWLITFLDLPEQVERTLVDCLTHSGALASLASVAAARDSITFRNEEHMFAWLAIDVLVRFDIALPNLSGIGTEHPEFIWFLRNRFQFERRGATHTIGIGQAKWIISQFRAQWPYAVLNGSGSGNTNPYDATDFLRTMINRIANDTSLEATEAMQVLMAEPPDSYSDLIRHMAAEQRQKRAEEEFAPLFPKDLEKLLIEGPPTNADDLKSLVLEELSVAQKILRGDDVDQVRDFWSDLGIPYDENRCRDRLAAIIGPELIRYDIHRITEADMPKNKRADLAFARGRLQLPMEVKGQWHSNVWDAATEQLDLKYLIDWRSEQRGIYCVLWFGDLPSSSGRRLQAPPTGFKSPASANEMRKMLVSRIPEGRRALIDVVVVDLTAGKP